jgi:hypothetical protein
MEAPSNAEPIAPLRADDHHPIDSSIEEDAPPLRVDTPTPLLPEPTKVHFAPSPSETMQPTYNNSTGIQGQQRRRTQRKRQPLSSSATIHPKRHTRQSPVPVSNHRYATRSKSKADPSSSAAYALPGNTINPDTGIIAEYKELSLCTEGPL